MPSHDHRHRGLHSEQGPLSGEHSGRAVDPVIKVRDIAWLEFEKPDLAAAEVFARAFGFTTVHRAAGELTLRGTLPGAPCVMIRKGSTSRFLGTAFHAADPRDLLRLADATGTKVRTLPEHIGGLSVDVREPAGSLVRVVADVI